MRDYRIAIIVFYKEFIHLDIMKLIMIIDDLRGNFYDEKN